MRLRWLGLFLVSSAVLLLEIALTRIFSALFFSYAAYLALSVALFGLCAGSLIVYWRPGLRDPARAPGVIQGASWGLALGAVLTALLVTKYALPLQDQFHPLSGHFLLPLLGAGLLSAIPFCFGGLIVTVAFAAADQDIGMVYAANLTGSAAGCLLALWALDAAGAPGSVLAAGLLALAGGWLWSRPRGRGWIVSAALAAGVAALWWAGSASVLLEVRSGKSDVGPALYRHWNSFSYITVHEVPHDRVRDWIRELSPSFTAKYPAALPDEAVIFIDAFGYAPILKWPVAETAQPALAAHLTAVPYRMRPGARAYLIGPGGGRDVVVALANGAARVEGAEINPIIVHDVMGRVMRDYAGGIYQRPDVAIVTADARQDLAGRRQAESDRPFDIIQANSAETWAASASGALALVENTLYTKEAFNLYLDQLSPNGVVAFSFWDDPHGTTALRMLRQWAAVAQERRLPSSAAGIAVLRNPGATPPYFTEVLYAPQGWSAPDRRRLQDAESWGFELMYPRSAAMVPAPNHPPPPFAQALDPAQWAQLDHDLPVDVSPATDDRPYFFFTSKWSALLEAAGYGVHNQTYILLSVLGAVLLIAVLVVLAVPGRSGWTGAEAGAGRSLMGVCCWIGFGFMFLEVACLQRAALIIGNPTLSFAAVVAGLLIGAGLGSAPPVRPDPGALRRACSWCVLMVAAMWFILGLKFYEPGAALLLSSPIGALVAVALPLLVLSIPLGIPFPQALALARARVPRALPWLVGVNGAAGVAATVLAVLAAVHWGIRATFGVAALCYYVAFFSAWRLPASTPPKKDEPESSRASYSTATVSVTPPGKGYRGR